MNPTIPTFPAYQNINADWYLIEADYYFSGHDAIFVVESGGRLALCDAGIGKSTPLVLDALAKLGHSPEAVDYLFISHAHLDHCAGAGHLMAKLPNATLVCHEKTKKHLAAPEQLIGGARNLYGEDYDSLYGEVLATPAERIITATDGQTFTLGDKTLEVIHIPGHTFDHIGVVDKSAETVFVGDAFGICLPAEFGLPPVARIPAAPTQFDPKGWIASINRIVDLKLPYVLCTHYGAMPEPIPTRGQELIADIETFINYAKELRGQDDVVDKLRTKIRQRWVDLLGSEPPDEKLIAIDLLLSSRGIALWMDKHLDDYEAG